MATDEGEEGEEGLEGGEGEEGEEGTGDDRKLVWRHRER